MNRQDRARQFMPFASLKGYFDKIREQQRIKEPKQQYEGWVSERDKIAIEIKESNDLNRLIYKNIDLIIDFCNRIPELYIKADLDNKRTMLRLLIEEILYNHIDTELSVKLKPIFEALRMIKEAERHDEKVLTLEKPVREHLV